jgi:hypothetical protein
VVPFGYLSHCYTHTHDHDKTVCGRKVVARVPTKLRTQAHAQETFDSGFCCCIALPSALPGIESVLRIVQSVT